MNQLKFTHNLIKGKIAEIIFEQMIHNVDGYTILEFGYEKVVRQLAHTPKTEQSKKTIEIVQRAPDFAIVNETTHDITLVEVKYMRNTSPTYVLKAARTIRLSWKKASLFIVSPDGFYFGDINKIIENKGAIEPFHHKLISQKKQQAYLNIVNEFIR